MVEDSELELSDLIRDLRRELPNSQLLTFTCEEDFRESRALWSEPIPDLFIFDGILRWELP